MSLDDALAQVRRPDDDAPQGSKVAYATKLAALLATEVSKALRARGLGLCLPDPGSTGGRERRFAGGIGAKRVDVSAASEETGLCLAITLKGIYFPDATRMAHDGAWRFSKNLMNRKADLLAEATTLHKRFPYAVVGGLFLMDERADSDVAAGHLSTYRRAHQAIAAFTGRKTPGDAVELLEGVVLGKVKAGSKSELSWAGQPDAPTTLDDFLTVLLAIVAERNSDHYEFDGVRINPI